MVYGNQFNNVNENDEQERIVLELESDILSLCEELLFLEDSAMTKITLKIGKKDVDLYIRNKEGGKGGANLTHGPSLKIINTKLNMPSIIIPGENEKAKVDPNVNSKIAKEVEKNYKGVIEFTDKNAETLRKIYHCNNMEDFNKYINEIINADCNKEYSITRKKA